MKVSKRILYFGINVLRSAVGAWLGWQVAQGWADILGWEPDAPSVILAAIGAVVVPFLLIREDRKPPGRSLVTHLPDRIQTYLRTISGPLIGVGAGFFSVMAGGIAFTMVSFSWQRVTPLWLDALVGLASGFLASVLMLFVPKLKKSAIWCALSALATGVWLYL